MPSLSFLMTNFHPDINGSLSVNLGRMSKYWIGQHSSLIYLLNTPEPKKALYRSNWPNMNIVCHVSRDNGRIWPGRQAVEQLAEAAVVSVCEAPAKHSLK